MEASSTTINKDRYCVLFFNVPLRLRVRISKLLGFQRSTLTSNYLGSLVIEKAQGNMLWENLLSNLEKKLESWDF